jgi:hypothetical protein
MSIFISLKANHNKDYSVVKTFKAAQVAFSFTLYTTALHLTLRSDLPSRFLCCRSLFPTVAHRPAVAFYGFGSSIRRGI